MNLVFSSTAEAICAVVAGITIGFCISIIVIAADIGLVNLW